MVLFQKLARWMQPATLYIMLPLVLVVIDYPTKGLLITQGNCTCNTTIGNSSLVDPTTPSPSPRPSPTPTPVPTPTQKAIRFKIAAFYSLKTAPFLKELVSALKVAVDIINNDPKYPVSFDYTIIDTGLDYRSCQKSAQALGADIDLIIGATRSFCTMAIARVTRSRKLPIIAYSATSTALSNKVNFPYVFRTCPSDEQQGKALAEIVHLYDWNKVGVISANDSYAANLARVFEDNIRKQRVEVVTSQRVQINITSSRSLIQYFQPVKKGSAVNVLSVGPFLFGSRFAPAAIKAKVIGPGWTWLMSDGVTFSDYSGPGYKEVRQALQGALGVATKGGLGPVFDHFVSVWKQKDSKNYPGAVHTGGKPMTSAAQLYDAVLAYTVALTNLYNKGDVNKNTSRTVVRDRLIESLKNISFVGALGIRQSFDKNGDGPATYDIKNYIGGSWVNVGFYDEMNGLNLTGQDIVWSGGSFHPYTTELPSEQCDTRSSDCDQFRSTITWLVVGLGVAGVLCIVLFFITLRQATKIKNIPPTDSIETAVYRNYAAEDNEKKTQNA